MVMPTAPRPAPPASPVRGGPWFLARPNLQVLIDLLRDDGRTVIAPTVADGAIVYDEITSIADLPVGWGDDQAPGRYRLVQRDDERLFGFTVGPTSWKKYTFPATVPLTDARKDGGSVRFEAHRPEPPPLAFLGVRACEIAALLVQDRVLIGGQFADEDYRARRAAAFVVAVQCTTAGATCFCTSMNTGPEVRGGHDLVLTELGDGFLVAAGSPAGADLLARLPLRAADPEQVTAAGAAVAAVAQRIGNPVQTTGLRERLLSHFDSPHWQEVSERCLLCANCTLACPTCFCTSVVQRSDLEGSMSTSERTWDSCFTVGFAKVAGGNFRSRPRDRYRQWLSHKFATWVDQFGTFGCVGCGRCITWCPVGIDVREELAVIAPPLAARPEIAPQRAAAGSPAEYTTARIRSVRAETADVVTLVLENVHPALLAGQPGQFAMLDLPAFPPLPISISRYGTDTIELTIRAAGPATTRLTRLAPGDGIGLRGPLGTAWPIERAVGRDVAIVTGGIGLAPLRPLIDAVLAQRAQFRDVRLFYGARTPRDMLYTDELRRWADRGEMEVELTVDRAGPEWLGRVGVVTHLFDQATWDGTRAIAYICGPERMMQATAAVLDARGFTPDRIFVTLERHMECGIGLCGHCQMGGLFVCRDGPVFSLRQLGDLFGREGI